MPRHEKWRGPDGFLKSGIKLGGSKCGNARASGRSKIYQLEPPDVLRYAEFFLGSGSILFGKDRHPEEYAIDVDPYSMNFFRCLQRQYKALWREIWISIGEDPGALDKEWFDSVRLNLPDKGDRIAWAAWYYVLNKHGRNGLVRFNKKGVCNSSFGGEAGNRGLYDLTWYKKVVSRIQGVKLACGDYRKLLNHLRDDNKLGKHTWLILDPPYSQVQLKYNQVDFSNSDHTELRNQLRDVGHAKWLLTINDNNYIRKLYREFNILEHDLHYSISNTKEGRGSIDELIITNYDCKLKVPSAY